MLYPFLQLLLQVLVQKSHAILEEEICSCVYSMAAVDFSFYHRQFLVKFLDSIEGLTSEQRTSLVHSYKTVEASTNTVCSELSNILSLSLCSCMQDLPSFVHNVRLFTSDLRYFIILNSSVPAGSVKL